MAEPGSREHKLSRFVDRIEHRRLLEDEALSIDEGPAKLLMFWGGVRTAEAKDGG
jgi:hypothetical protein